MIKKVKVTDLVCIDKITIILQKKNQTRLGKIKKIVKLNFKKHKQKTKKRKKKKYVYLEKNKNKIGENAVYKLVKTLIYWSKDREVGYLLMAPASRG